MILKSALVRRKEQKKKKKKKKDYKCRYEGVL
jgi:hypothetical protein